MTDVPDQVNLVQSAKRKSANRPAKMLYVPPAIRNTHNEQRVIKSPVKETRRSSTQKDDILRIENDLNQLHINSATPVTTTVPPAQLAHQSHRQKQDDDDHVGAILDPEREIVMKINRRSRPLIKHVQTQDDVLHIGRDVNGTPATSSWEDLARDESGVGRIVSISVRHDHDDDSRLIEDCSDVDSKDRRYDSTTDQSRNEDLDHVIEVYDFPAALRTHDLVMIFDDLLTNDSGFVKWCDDTHALIVFGTGLQARKALGINNGILKSRPATQASKVAKQVIAASDLRPPMKRPQTSMQTARRMITSALGARTTISREVREKEQEELRKAKELRRNKKKYEQDAWDGNPKSSVS